MCWSHWVVPSEAIWPVGRNPNQVSCHGLNIAATHLQSSVAKYKHRSLRYFGQEVQNQAQ